MREVVIFQLKGKFAHYRKFYTNSSSLTYGIPPRTALAGCIAGMLGYEKDTYYDLFSPERAYITVRKMHSTKKLMQSVNYMKITSVQHFNGSNGPTQIPIEMLCSWDEPVVFQVYFSHEDKKLQTELIRRLREKRFVYPPYLGSASFLASAEFVNVCKAEKRKIETDVCISTALPLDSLQQHGIRFTDIHGNLLSIHKENMLQYFVSERNLGEVKPYVFEESGRPISVKLVKPYYYLAEQEENIMFM
ncbi:MAG: type I-B CRISPR-associated protein Cas5b [Ectobacillus sp.]